MNEKTLTALKGSIAKWQAIVDSTEAENLGSDNCPLCQVFNPGVVTSAHHECKGCPVAERTGEGYCEGSPYYYFTSHTQHVHKWRQSREPDCPECLRLATAELDFLKSLLPTA